VAIILGLQPPTYPIEQTSILWVDPPLEAEKPMCEKCAELNVRIERYRRITGSFSDEITISRIKELVAKLETQKAELHPEQQN
jgi:hypothetical protein